MDIVILGVMLFVVSFAVTVVVMWAVAALVGIFIASVVTVIMGVMYVCRLIRG